MLRLLNDQAAQHLPGPYSIVGLLDSGGAHLDGKSLRGQGVHACIHPGSAVGTLQEREKVWVGSFSKRLKRLVGR